MERRHRRNSMPPAQGMARPTDERRAAQVFVMHITENGRVSVVSRRRPAGHLPTMPYEAFTNAGRWCGDASIVLERCTNRSGRLQAFLKQCIGFALAFLSKNDSVTCCPAKRCRDQTLSAGSPWRRGPKSLLGGVRLHPVRSYPVARCRIDVYKAVCTICRDAVHQGARAALCDLFEGAT
jgi:hypothetical protein